MSKIYQKHIDFNKIQVKFYLGFLQKNFEVSLKNIEGLRKSEISRGGRSLNQKGMS